MSKPLAAVHVPVRAAKRILYVRYSPTNFSSDYLISPIVFLTRRNSETFFEIAS